ncbi:hypothetical protein LTR53_011727, partial [Teratosphaeriaceae sp. CCFEE 6253]
ALQLALEGGDLEEIKSHLSIREIKTTLPALKITAPALAPAVGEPAKTNGAATGVQRAASSEASRAPAVNGSTNGHHPTPARLSHDHHNHDHDHDRHDDTDITLSFESPNRPTHFHSHHASSYSNGDASRLGSASPTVQSSRHGTPPPWDSPRTHLSSREASSEQPRPPLRSANTTPAQVSAHQPSAAPAKPPDDSNPWADEEDFGREKEMEMRFD